MTARQQKLFVVALKDRPLRQATIRGIAYQQRKAEKIKMAQSEPTEIIVFVPREGK